MNYSPVLVLNQNFEPLNVCNVRRALVLVLDGKAEVLELNHQIVYTATLSIHCPSVIRLSHLITRPRPRARLSRREIFIRDNYTCQYCGRVFPPQELTLDHIVPRSRNGDSSWDNLVTCCRACNNRKSDQSPEAAGMRLLKRPQAYNLHVNRQIIRYIGRSDEAWRKYLFY